jgi:hypothetical protein
MGKIDTTRYITARKLNKYTVKLKIPLDIGTQKGNYVHFWYLDTGGERWFITGKNTYRPLECPNAGEYFDFLQGLDDGDFVNDYLQRARSGERVKEHLDLITTMKIKYKLIC